MSHRDPIRRRSRTGINAALFLATVLLMVQMWLLTATLESYLAGYRDAALPGMILSGVLFTGCAGLYAFTRRLDKGV